MLTVGCHYFFIALYYRYMIDGMKISPAFKILSALFFALLIASPNFANADGWRFRHGRFPEGKVTVLELTQEQKDFLGYIRKCLPGKPPYNKWSPYIFKLTSKQSSLLKREAGFSPQRFAVFESYKGDVGIDLEVNTVNRFSEHQVEVPHILLAPDKEAHDWQVNVIGWKPNPLENTTSERIKSGICAAQLETQDTLATSRTVHLKKKAKQGSVQALKDIQRAAEAGNTEAQEFLCYSLSPSKRQAVPSEEVAVKWCHHLAEKGFSVVQRFLGFVYSSGRGVKQDYLKAYFWYRLAELSGNETAAKDAATFLPHVVEHLTAEQRAEIDKSVMQWKSRHPMPKKHEH